MSAVLAKSICSAGHTEKLQSHQWAKLNEHQIAEKFATLVCRSNFTPDDMGNGYIAPCCWCSNRHNDDEGRMSLECLACDFSGE